MRGSYHCFRGDRWPFIALSRKAFVASRRASCSDENLRSSRLCPPPDTGTSIRNVPSISRSTCRPLNNGEPHRAAGDRRGGGHSTDGSAYAKTRDGTADPPFAARVLTGASVAAATLLGERAATSGRGATEGGDEHAGVKPALSVRPPASRTGSLGGNLDAFGGLSTD